MGSFQNVYFWEKITSTDLRTKKQQQQHISLTVAKIINKGTNKKLKLRNLTNINTFISIYLVKHRLNLNRLKCLNH